VATSTDILAFDRLAPPLQRWLWEQGWSGLREAQAAALPLLLDGEQDVVIAAATASGKTEAAFLPLLTRLWQEGGKSGGKGMVLYVAPMKALINDQFERLGLICERLDIPVTPWHGDVGAAPRKRFFADPRGVVLITPESLESLLFRRGAELGRIFAGLEAVIVDELHAFIGGERGRQLQSLLHRLDAAVGRRVRRVGLSATLGDMGLAAEFLRPGAGAAVAVIVSSAEKKRLDLVFKAVLVPPGMEETLVAAHQAIAAELFNRLRDANYLIFPNTTGLVEQYADSLRLLSEAARVPVSFFPHHGRLGKAERQTTEAELKRGDRPISAICTTTLEMGIDIGAIRGVVQIGAPDTVSSLCQRIGRAGRRAEESARLWQYCVAEEPRANMGCALGLHAGFIQALAIIRLYLAKWYEPPRSGALHTSTLVQQILALIGERHGISAADAYRTLCLSGPFGNISEADFIDLLRALAAQGLIMQDATRLLLHGPLGEKRVNHFTFFAAFPDTQEYRLMHAGKELGTLPLKMNHQVGSVVIFAGRRWRMAEIDHDKRRVELIPATVGDRPRTRGEGSPVHDRVRAEMRAVLAGEDEPEWLEEKASEVLRAARQHYRDLDLNARTYVVEGSHINLFLWHGDAVQDALVALLISHGLKAENHGICIEIGRSSLPMLFAVLRAIAAEPCPQVDQILNRQAIGNPEKWDWVLPDRLFYASFASSRLDLAAAHAWCVAWVKLEDLLGN
jgi:ATP-dependent helicase Lhr and Lhr-like helicase